MAETATPQDWTQWMRWDVDEEQSSNSPSDPAGSNENTCTPSRSNSIQRIYPASPASSRNDQPSMSVASPEAVYRLNGHIHGPPTPDHTSSSPENLHLPESQPGEEVPREIGPSESSRLRLKRKASEAPELAMENGATPSHQKQANQKRPHNVIEKRYRANLNEKIAELRESVPCLQSSTKKLNVGRDLDENEDPIAPTKLNKAYILTKAVEHIQHLELRNKRLDDENLSLKDRLSKLEKVLALSEDGLEKRATAFTCSNVIEETPKDSGNHADREDRLAKHPPNGLIPVPESMRKLRQSQPQNHYGAVYDAPPEGKQAGRRWPAKIMLGSLAGLMIVDGLSERQEGSESQQKGLFGIPLKFLDGWWFLRSPRDFVAAFVQYCRAGGVLPLVKGFCALTLLAFMVFAYLFNSKPVKTEQPEKPSQPRKAPSLASPLAVRRQAWCTSMHTLKLPHHAFFPEWFAVTMEWLKYTIRLILGFSSYHRITGLSAEDEMARVKAWDIAIDAQLAGGDPEISRSRLVLTIFASGTLPQTPARLMLKALHCRIVLWKVGRHGGAVSRASDRIAMFLADRQWRKARSLAAAMKEESRPALPTHLNNLLLYDCKDVMLHAVLDRAYNLMYDRAIAGDGYGAGSLMDVVVEDHAVRSPLDALAAWWSSQRLYRALIVSTTEGGPDRLKFTSTLDAALAIAPPLSAAHTRALAIKAVFFDDNRSQNAERVIAALPTPRLYCRPELYPRFGASLFIDSSIPPSACDELYRVLTCATIMAELHGSRHISGFAHMKRVGSDLFAELTTDNSTMTILSFAASLHVLLQLLKDDEGNNQPCDHADYSKTIRELVRWAHGESAKPAHLSPGVVAKLDLLASHCEGKRKSKRRQSDASHDTGYGSQGEVEGD